jgi:hypothetical protein
MSQLGRIGGQVLTDNLLRAGIDLAFENNLLYLDVDTRKIGINRSPPIYDLDVNSDIRTTDLTVDNQLAVGNIRINAPDTFTTSVGRIDVFINGTEIFHDKLLTSSLVVDGNKISSINNENILLDPNGSGTVELLTNTDITGNLVVTGNINITGNLSSLGTLTVGDTVFDTVTVNTDFTQDITLGDNELYRLGTPSKRWDRIYATDWAAIGTAGVGIVTSNITTSDQVRITGSTANITSIQSNEDLFLNASTGTVELEQIAWNTNDISNLLSTPLELRSTARGYYVFQGDNGLMIPSGTNSERRSSPEVGETRWNTEEGYLECFDGTLWTLSTGAGEEVTQELMEDLGNIWILTLG